MRHLPNFIFLILFLVCLALAHATFSAGDVDHFVYAGFTGAGAAANLTVDGTARISHEGLLELTNGKPNIKGHAFYPTPFQFKKSPNGTTVRSFSAAFVFGIVSDTGVSTDGMAFVVAPTMDFSGAMHAQFLGLFNNQTNRDTTGHVFAVELDTIQNSEFQDIDDNHVGVDVNSLSSLQPETAGFFDDESGGAFRNLTLGSCQAIQVWVDYSGDAKQINVTLAPVHVDKPARPLISAAYDLSHVLSDQAYVGFSAATGPLGSRHCVLGWSFAMDAPSPAIAVGKLPDLPCSGRNTIARVLEIAVPVTTASVVLGCIAAILLVRRQMAYAELREDWEVEFGPHRFSYKDLFKATEGFKEKCVLGVGGFGKVYKGVLSKSKSEVAVKKVSHGSSQGMKEFISEVVSIGHLRHRNLVQLLGYCRRKGELLLVYDYMSNGSLDKYIHSEGGKPVLNWPRRFQIIKDVASGLFYLHEKWEQVVIHRDIKASNVLLDGEMNGRLGDFGLARLYDHGTDPQTTHLVGTMGYLAPELARTGRATPLTDVFAFGTFLLEVTCGRRPISNSVQYGRRLLVDWVLQHCQRGSLTNTVDPKLEDDYNVDEACLVLRLGLMCSHPFPNVRPTMRQVLQYLDGDMPLPELTPESLSFSLLTLMQQEGLDHYAAVRHPLSITGSLGSMTPDISSGR